MHTAYKSIIKIDVEDRVVDSKFAEVLNKVFFLNTNNNINI
jgi:hypothetical protein